MVARGDVTPRYADGMIEKERQYSTWITEGVALPHGTNEVKSEVRRNSLIVVQLPKGVDWGNGKTVYLAIGLAGSGDQQHLKLLAALAGSLQHGEVVEKLKTATNGPEVVQLLTSQEAPQS
jgi:mannitol/fructose-specific phosphotransferase system IIA component